MKRNTSDKHGAVLRVAMTVEQLWQPVPGGSGTYIRELAAEFTSRPGLDVCGLAARRSHSDGHEGNDGNGLPDAMKVWHSRLPRPAMYESWLRQRRHHWLPAAMPSELGADVIHATTWAIPPRVAPLVVTIQDVAFRRSPEYFTKRGVKFFERALAVARDEADLIIVPSKATLDDCVEAGIEAGRLRLAPLGVRKREVSPEEVTAFTTRYGLEKDFILWCGTVEPRKNVARFILACAEVVSGDADLDVVLIGPDGWGQADTEVTAAIESLPPARVHRLGMVSERDLAAAYAAARVFCFPSLWEGFGLPVLEAQAHGTPVVTSANTSMEEIGGDAVRLIDPTDIASIANGIIEAAGPLRESLSMAGQANAAKYTWRQCALRHEEIYCEARTL